MAGARRTSPQATQTRLLLSRDARLDALNRIGAKGIGLSATQWRHVKLLLREIENTTGRDGCFCYVETIMARMGNVSKSTYIRTRKAALALGLVAIEERWNKRGQQSNEWRVCWDRVSALAGRACDRSSPAATGSPGGPRTAEAGPRQQHERTAEAGPRRQHERTAEAGPRREDEGACAGRAPTGSEDRGAVPEKVTLTDTHPCQPGTGGCQVGTPLLRNISSSENSLQTRSTAPGAPSIGDDQVHGVERTKKTAAGPRRRAGPARWRSVDWPLARAAAVKVARAVGRPRCGADWSLALKAAALAAVLGEGWLWGAVEGVVRRKSPADNPWAYLHRCLDDGAKQRGARLPRLLAQIVIPPEVLADGPERPEARLNCDRAMLAEL